MNIDDLELEAKWSRLNTVFDVSSEKNRNLLMLLIVVSAYVISISVGVSDVDLLLGSGAFEMPLIGAKVSVMHFFISAPIIIFLLHINMLVNLSEHVRLLKTWKSVNGERSYKFPYMINLLVIESNRTPVNKTKLLTLQFMVFCAVVFLPTFALAVTLWGFADYQSQYIATFQFTLFVFDIYITGNLLSKLQKGLFRNELSFLVKVPSKCYFVAISVFTAYFFAAVWLILSWPAAIKYLISDDQGVVVESRLNCLPVIDVSSKTLSKVKPEYQVILGLQNQPWDENMSQVYNGIDLSNRNLAFAKFDNVYAQATKFEGANIYNAYFRKAKLVGSRFDHAIVEASNFDSAKMQTASFEQTQIDNSTFVNTDLQSGNFANVEINNVTLNNALLSNSDFFDANFYNSNFDSADIYAVSFMNATITGSSFKQAVLSGSDFTDTEIDYSGFVDAKMLVTKFHHTIFRHVDFTNADLLGADITQSSFDSTNLVNVNFTATRLFGNKFNNCQTDRTSYYEVHTSAQDALTPGCHKIDSLPNNYPRDYSIANQLNTLESRAPIISQKSIASSRLANQIDAYIDLALNRLKCENCTAVEIYKLSESRQDKDRIE